MRCDLFAEFLVVMRTTCLCCVKTQVTSSPMNYDVYQIHDGSEFSLYFKPNSYIVRISGLVLDVCCSSGTRGYISFVVFFRWIESRLTKRNAYLNTTRHFLRWRFGLYYRPSEKKLVQFFFRFLSL